MSCDTNCFGQIPYYRDLMRGKGEMGKDAINHQTRIVREKGEKRAGLCKCNLVRALSGSC